MRCARTAVIPVLLLAFGLAGCSDDAAPAGSPADRPDASREVTSTPPATPAADVKAQRLVADVVAADAAPSNLPADAALPKGRVRSIQADPPGRAVLAVARTADWVRPARNGTRVSYLVGEDGRWRALDLADYGLERGELAVKDAPAPGQLSPDGGFYAVATVDGVLFVNLATGDDRLAPLPNDARPGLLQWTAWNTLLVGEYIGLTTYELATSGRVVNSLDVPLEQLGTTPGGRYVRYQRAGDRLMVTSLSPTGDPIRPPAETPFPALPLPGQHSGTAVALWQHLGGAGDAGRDVLVVAADGTLEPQARLAWPGRANDDWTYGWLRDGSTLLLRSDRTLFTWDPEAAEAVKLSTLPRGVIASPAMQLVEVRTP